MLDRRKEKRVKRGSKNKERGRGRGRVRESDTGDKSEQGSLRDHK